MKNIAFFVCVKRGLGLFVSRNELKLMCKL